MNELINIEVESVEGEHLTQVEYQIEQVMKIQKEQMRTVAERERIKRRHEQDMELFMVQARLKQSMAFAEALHGYDIKRDKQKDQRKKLNKAWDVIVHIVILIGLSFLVWLVWVSA